MGKQYLFRSVKYVMWPAIGIFFFEELKEKFPFFYVPKVIRDITGRANVETGAGNEHSVYVLSLAFLLFPAFTGINAISVLILSPYLEASGVNTECLVLDSLAFSVVWFSLSPPQF